MHRRVNFTIGALLITIVGAGASLIIIHTAANAEYVGYDEALVQLP
jgi:hypothetical protein